MNHLLICARWLPRALGHFTAVLRALALSLLAAAPSSYAETVVGNGKPGTEARTTSEFSGIALSGGMALRVKQGNSTAVIVHAETNLLSLIESFVDSDKVLQLRWKRGTSVRVNSDTYVEVTAPQLRSVSSAGSGDVTIDGLKGSRLALAIRGSGALRGKSLSYDEIALGIDGSGDVGLVGRAAKFSVDLAGAGDIDAGELKADDVRISIAGSGSAAVHASRTLAVSIAGSGDVTYSGDPSVQRSIAGSGSVRKR